MGKTSFDHPVKTRVKAGQNWLPGKTGFVRPVKTAVLTGQNWPVGKTCQPCFYCDIDPSNAKNLVI